VFLREEWRHGREPAAAGGKGGGGGEDRG